MSDQWITDQEFLNCRNLTYRAWARDFQDDIWDFLYKTRQYNGQTEISNQIFDILESNRTFFLLYIDTPIDQIIANHIIDIETRLDTILNDALSLETSAGIFSKNIQLIREMYVVDGIQDGLPKVTIIIDTSLIDEALTNFPLHVKLTNSCGLSAADATGFLEHIGYERRNELAAYYNGNQVYMEIEHWEEDNNSAHFNILLNEIPMTGEPTITLQLGSDIDYTGEIDSNAGHNVFKDAYDWDSVYHFSQLPKTGGQTFLNSGEAGDATNGYPHPDAELGVTIQTDPYGKKSWDFAGDNPATQKEFILCSNTSRHRYNNDGFSDVAFTWECWLRVDNLEYFPIISKRKIGGNSEYLWWFNAGKRYSVYLYDEGTGSYIINRSEALTEDGQYHYYVATYDARGKPNGIRIIEDLIDIGSLFSSGGTYIAMNNAGEGIEIASDRSQTLLGQQYADGKFGEIRMSRTIRSQAWLKATYNSFIDNLLKITVTGVGT